MSFIHAFLEQLAYQGMQDNTVQDITEGQGTVKPFAQFDAAMDAGVLDKAIKAKGVDELTIIETLVRRSNAQRQQIKAAYQQTVGKPLDVALKAALKGELEEVVLGLLMTPAQYDSFLLHGAMKATRSEDKVVQEELADKDARALYEAGEKRKGTDCGVFIDILTSRNACHLRRVFQLYSKYSKVDVAKAIDLELKGDIETCLIAVGKILTRILVRRSEIDLAKIKQEYQNKFGKSLYQDIQDDTKGDYETILLALCGQ
ncbi:hypothetical protein cypCar_00025459 [Cyprinus carpio]|nr:hypothetical protein cypCar_00025459 [Cyprinus carpio]